MTLHLSKEGRVVLNCDAPSCGKQFTVDAVAARKTRHAANDRGWSTAARDGDRRDLCPEHVDVAAPAETGRCRAHFWESSSRCEKTAGHDGAHRVSGFATWGDDLSTFHNEPKLSGGLLDLLEEATS